MVFRDSFTVQLGAAVLISALGAVALAYWVEHEDNKKGKSR